MKLITIQAHFKSKTRRCIISDALNECALYCYESGCYYESRMEPGGLSGCQGCCCARVIRYLKGTITLTKYELSLICGRKYGRLCACPLQPGTISTPESEDYIPW